MKRITSIITFLFCAFIGSFSFGQSYPVQTNIHLTGPFTNHIPDYLDPGNSKFQVALQITDANIGVLNVRLKLKLTGPNGEMVTRSTYAPPMITLNYGVPTMLDGSDLASYFDVNNLSFSNSQIQTAYTNTSNLQEGFWTWCVEVYDATNPTAEVLSTNNCHITFIATNLPPITNLPVCGAVLPHEPTVLFNWTIMPSVLPEGAVETFTFQLYAIPIASFVNVSQVLSMSPIFYTTLPAGTSTYVLNTNEVLLSPQFHYVWRIHVNNGISGSIPNSSSYMNQGFSVPCDFLLENNDQIAINSLELALTSVATGTTTGKSTWTVTDTENNNNQFDGFVLAYRKAGNPDYTWYEQDVVAFEYNLTQLEANTTYETKLKGYIGNEESDWTAIDTFTTNPEPVLACGQGVPPTLPPTYEPLNWLFAFPGIQVTQGQFTMMVTSISPVVGAEPGHFKGTGFMYIPFLYFAMQVHFDDLEIDDQKVARSGDVKVVSQGLDAWLDSQYAAEVTPVNIDGVISSYTFNEPFTSVSVVIDGVTTIYTVTDPLPTILQDDDNKEYQFWPDGRVIVKPYGIVPSNDHLAITTDKMVNFIDSEDQAYPTDVKEYAHLAENYECIIEGEIKYFVANKSALSGATDLVKAKVHIVDNFDRALLSFRLAFSNDTITYTYNPSDSTCTFSIPEKTSNYSLYAYYGTAKVGKLDVKVFTEVTKKVRIVPLMSVASITDFTEQNIETTLNSIYRGAHVKIDATIAEPFNTDVFTSATIFDNPDVEGMSMYTAQMKALRDAYKATPGIQMATNEYLVFVVPSFTDQQIDGNLVRIDGYMVRGRALGFVAANSPTLIRTLAHELGHGIGGLEHAWESGAEQGATKNLMDYDPTHDKKMIASQWKSMHDAPLTLSFWDAAEDGSSVSFVANNIPENFKNPDGTLSFYVPNGSVITLPANTKELRFSIGDQLYYSNTNTFSNRDLPIGCLSGFIIQDGAEMVEFKVVITGNTVKYENTDASLLDEVVITAQGSGNQSNSTTVNNSDYKLMKYYQDGLSKNNQELKVLAGYAFFENETFGFNLFNTGSVSNVAYIGNPGIDSNYYVEEYLISGDNLPIMIGDWTRIDENWETSASYYAPLLRAQHDDRYEIYQFSGLNVNDFSPLSIDFLKRFPDLTSSKFGLSSILIAIANKLDSYSAFEDFSSCLVGDLAQTNVAQPASTSSFDYSFESMFGTNWMDNLLNSANWGASNDLDLFKLADRLKTISNNISSSATTELDINTELRNASTSSEVVTILNEYQGVDGTPDFLCQLSLIDVDNRLKAINLLKNDETNVGYIAKLTNTTLKTSQVATIYDAFFKDDAELFKTCVESYTDWKDDPLYGTFMHSLLSMANDVNFEKQVEHTQLAVDSGFIDLMTINSTVNSNLTEDVFLTYNIQDEDFFDANASVGNHYRGIDLKYTDFVRLNLDKFSPWADPSFIAFLDNAGLKKSDIIIPAFYLQYISETFISQQQISALFGTVRFAVNVAAIIAAIPSGGTSLTTAALITSGLTIFSSSLDIVVQFSEDKLGESEAGQNFLDFYETIMWIDLGNGVFQLGRGIYKNAAKKLYFKPSEIIEGLESSDAAIKQQALISYEAALQFFKRINKFNASLGDTYRNLFLKKLDAVFLETQKLTYTNPCSFVINNNYRITIARNGLPVNLLTIESNSEGFFLKGAIQSADEAGTECARLSNVRYRSGTSILEGDLKIIQKADGSFRVIVAGKFDEFLTVDGKVKKAGNRSDLYNSFATDAAIPSRYSSSPRFSALATDQATGVDVINSKTRQEAMAGLEAESQGLIDGPIVREPTGDFEFIDANGNYWDVKAPPSQGMNTANQINLAGIAIRDQLLSPGVRVILDCTWMSQTQLASLRSWIVSNISSSDLNRIVEVNSNVF